MLEPLTVQARTLMVLRTASTQVHASLASLGGGRSLVPARTDTWVCSSCAASNPVRREAVGSRGTGTGSGDSRGGPPPLPEGLPPPPGDPSPAGGSTETVDALELELELSSSPPPPPPPATATGTHTSTGGAPAAGGAERCPTEITDPAGEGKPATLGVGSGRRRTSGGGDNAGGAKGMSSA